MHGRGALPGGGVLASSGDSAVRSHGTNGSPAVQTGTTRCSIPAPPKDAPWPTGIDVDTSGTVPDQGVPTAANRAAIDSALETNPDVAAAVRSGTLLRVSEWAGNDDRALGLVAWYRFDSAVTLPSLGKVKFVPNKPGEDRDHGVEAQDDGLPVLYPTKDFDGTEAAQIFISTLSGTPTLIFTAPVEASSVHPQCGEP